MAVQFNLLPDVKLEFQQQQHAKKVVYGLSTLAVAVCVGIFVLSFLVVNVLQAKLLSDANSNINKYTKQLQAIPNLDKVLTIQNQLNSLPRLHQQKHVTSRLFDYLPQITPTKVNIGKISFDTTASTLELDGTADTVESVNKFVDTLKFTTYSTQGKNTKKNAFNKVVLTKVDRDDKGASYTINTSFDPALFDASQNVTLVVPSETTTRSVLNTPDTTLFNGQTQTQTEQQKQQQQQGTQ